MFIFFIPKDGKNIFRSFIHPRMKYTHSVYFVGKTNARENGWYIGVAKIKSYIIFDGRDSHPDTSTAEW